LHWISKKRFLLDSKLQERRDTAVLIGKSKYVLTIDIDEAMNRILLVSLLGFTGFHIIEREVEMYQN